MRIFVVLLLSLIQLIKFAYEDELIFVQAVWRHGDRNPIASFPTDPYKNEANWTEGWGELTVKGMEQHVNLGQNLSNRYIDQMKFLNSGPYNSREIYIRSTDVNRTIISAISNLIGFFSNHGISGTNFPNISKWPLGYVPVPIHSFDYDIDHIGNPDATCPRQEELWKLVQQTPEYQNLMNNKTYKENLAQVQNLTGWTDLNLENMWYIADTLYIEHFVYNLSKVDPNLLALFNFINETTDLSYDWVNGWGIETYKNINFTEEIPKIRGGTLLWSLINLMKNKIHCRNNQNDTNDLCTWMKKLKYYAYSAHDTTLAALFSAFGFKRPNYNEDGYPHYSSCVTVELWLDNISNSYVKVYYIPLNEPLEDVTPYITGCTSNCFLDMFISRSQTYKPGGTGNIVDWCNTPLFGSDQSTTTPTNNSSEAPKIAYLICIFYIFLIFSFL